MNQGASMGKPIDLGYINPALVNENQDKSQALHFFLLKKKNKVFHKDTPYFTRIPDPKNPGKTVQVKFELTHDLVLERRDIHGTMERRYHIHPLDSDFGSFIGKGATATVKNVPGTLVHDLEKQCLVFKQRQRYARRKTAVNPRSLKKGLVVKIQEHGLFGNSRSATLEAERLAKILQSKPNVVVDRRALSATSYLFDKEFGTSLDDIEREKLSEDQLLSLSVNILRAFDEFHSYGYVYPDIKPENLLVDPDTTRVRMLDMGGISKIGKIAPASPINMLYLAPELFQIRKLLFQPRSEKSDIYSLGLLLLWLWGGQFRSVGLPILVRTLRNGKNDLINYSALNRTATTRVVQHILENMLQMKPDERKPLAQRIDDFEALRIERTVQEALQASVLRAYQVANATRKVLFNLSKTKGFAAAPQLKDALLSAIHRLGNTSDEVTEFARTTDVHAFQGLRTKQALLKKTAETIDAFTVNLDNLNHMYDQVSATIRLLQALPDQKNKDSITPLQALLSKMDRLLYKTEKRRCKLDDMARMNELFDANFKNFQAMLTESDQHYPEVINDQIQLMRKLVMPHADNAADKMKNGVRLAVKSYLLSTFTATTVKKRDRAASIERMKDMRDILNQLEENIDAETLKNNLLTRVGKCKTGFFGTSVLRRNVREAVSVYSKKVRSI
jgi:serine/threonine protein kinase